MTDGARTTFWISTVAAAVALNVVWWAGRAVVRAVRARRMKR